jgi:hypothetical protein
MERSLANGNLPAGDPAESTTGNTCCDRPDPRLRSRRQAGHDAELLAMRADIKWLHVAYAGSGQLMTDVRRPRSWIA